VEDKNQKNTQINIVIIPSSPEAIAIKFFLNSFVYSFQSIDLPQSKRVLTWPTQWDDSVRKRLPTLGSPDHLDIHLIGKRDMFLFISAIGRSSCPWIGTRTSTDKTKKPL